MDYFWQILSGIPMSLLITAGAFLIGVGGGIPLLALRVSRHVIPRLVGRTVIEVVRGVPPIVWLFIIFFGIGSGTFQLDALPASLAALGLVASAFMAEIYRGGLASIDRGQWEAGYALGLAPWTVRSRVIAPQVVRVSLPASTSFLVGLLKDSAIVSTIGVADITFRTSRAAADSFGSLQVYLYAAAAYLILGVPLIWLSRTIDRNLRLKVAR